jgi:MoxR-like ATPase
MSTTLKTAPTATTEYVEADGLDVLQGAFKALEHDLNNRIIGQPAAVRLSLVGLVSKKLCWFPGPPGTGKTTLAMELAKSITGAETFYVALSEEASDAIVLGPYNPMLLQQGKWERQLEGYMGTADIVILDEITRANIAVQSAILNPLEKRFIKNGNEQVQMPMMMAFGLSNDPFPDGAGALRDRFSLAMPFGRLSPTDRDKLREREMDGGMPQVGATITKEQVTLAQSLIDKVQIPKSVRNDIKLLVSQLMSGMFQNRALDISERQDIASIRPLKAHAFLDGRMTVTQKDYAVLAATLWTDKRDIAALTEALGSLSDIGRQAQGIAAQAGVHYQAEMAKYRKSRDESERERLLLAVREELIAVRKQLGMLQMQATNERLGADVIAKTTQAQALLKPMMEEVVRELGN